MKTIKTNFLKWIVAATLFIGCAFSSEKNENIPAKLPTKNLKAEDEHQYQVATDYYTYSIYGDFIQKTRFSGLYTSGLPDGKVKWNNAQKSVSTSLEGDYPKGDKLGFMEDFSYTYEDNILTPEFFESFPFDAVEAKNLVWDMAGMEFFAWGCTDSLQLNKAYHANEANGKVDLAGLGFFDNRDIILTYRGITEKNGESLSIVDFRTMNNPLKINIDLGNQQMQTKGRSHYWGTIYVSNDHACFDEIELYEDVLMETAWSGQEKQLVDVVREMKVTKIY